MVHHKRGDGNVFTGDDRFNAIHVKGVAARVFRQTTFQSPIDDLNVAASPSFEIKNFRATLAKSRFETEAIRTDETPWIFLGRKSILSFYVEIERFEVQREEGLCLRYLFPHRHEKRTDPHIQSERHQRVVMDRDEGFRTIQFNEGKRGRNL